jgi:hypothetical protein
MVHNQIKEMATKASGGVWRAMEPWIVEPHLFFEGILIRDSLTYSRQHNKFCRNSIEPASLVSSYQSAYANPYTISF